MFSDPLNFLGFLDFLKQNFKHLKKVFFLKMKCEFLDCYSFQYCSFEAYPHCYRQSCFLFLYRTSIIFSSVVRQRGHTLYHCILYPANTLNGVFRHHLDWQGRKSTVKNTNWFLRCSLSTTMLS